MNRRTIGNLRAFARLYGYVRYFHPSDEAAALDWDRFVVRGAGRVLGTGNGRGLKRTLEELFLPIAPTVRLFAGRPRRPDRPELPPRGVKAGPVVAWQHLGVGGPRQGRGYLYFSVRASRKNPGTDRADPVRGRAKPLFGKMPVWGEATVKPLGAGLWCRVPLTLRRTGKRTWGPPSPFPLEPLDPNRLVPGRADVRVAAVVIAWNVFQHFYPYFDVVGADWDAVLTESLAKALADSGADDFLLTLRRLVARLEDGHGNVWREGKSARRGYLPFKVDWIERRVVVTGAPRLGTLRPGDVVVSVDGKPGIRLLEDAEQYISGSPQWRRYRSLWSFGAAKPGSKAGLVVEREGRRFRAIVRRTAKQYPHDEAVEHERIQELGPGVFYVNLDKASTEEIAGRMRDLAAAKGVVFDLRGYPNADSEFICHLLRKKDTSGAWMRIPRTIYPDRERLAGWDDDGWFMKPARPHIGGKVVFLTDGRAISAAESYMSFIEWYKLAPIVGQPTAGTNGNINELHLPGGYGVRWTGMRVVKHDGSRHHLVGIRPTVPAERTVRGVREGRDEFLERALVEIGEDPALARAAKAPAPPARPRKTFILIFGPPVVGKMTVGQHLCRRTGYRLFHNHMTIDLLAPIFGFGTDRFARLLFETRRRILEEAAADEGVKGIVMTYSWAFGNPVCAEQVAAFMRPFNRRGARVLLVGLDASLRERLRRNRTENRLRHKPTMRDLKLSAGIIRSYGSLRSIPPPGWRAPAPCFLLDTTKLTARATAKAIQRHFGL
jgi:hypothetical protein